MQNNTQIQVDSSIANLYMAWLTERDYIKLVCFIVRPVMIVLGLTFTDDASMGRSRRQFPFFNGTFYCEGKSRRHLADLSTIAPDVDPSVKVCQDTRRSHLGLIASISRSHCVLAKVIIPQGWGVDKSKFTHPHPHSHEYESGGA